MTDLLSTALYAFSDHVSLCCMAKIAPVIAGKTVASACVSAESFKLGIWKIITYKIS